MTDDIPPPLVLLLGCGPRTGSTWVSRLLISSGCLVWGENNTLECLDHAGNDTWGTHLPDLRANGPNMTTAHLTPARGDVLDGWRLFFKGALGAPAGREGYASWGMKQVRWTASQVVRWCELWGDARVAYLVRDFRDVLRSLVGGGWDIVEYTARWCDASEAAIADCQVDTIGRSRIFRYEHLVNYPSAITQWLGLPPPDAALMRLNSSPGELSWEHLVMIKPYLDRINRIQCQLGYAQ